MSEAHSLLLRRRSLLIECIAWSVAVGAAVAGGRIYIDVRDNISDLLGDRWYFLRENIWWIPYYVALIGAPLLAVSEVHRRVLATRRGFTIADIGAAGDNEPGALANLTMGGFFGIYAAATVVASILHTVISNCIWSTLCGRGEWQGTLFVSLVFFALPLALFLLRRGIWAALRR